MYKLFLPFFPAVVLQVSQLGCSSFAILFDDIELRMCNEDNMHFASFAHAHVYVANAIYEHLNQPETFLFCPTGTCCRMVGSCRSLLVHLALHLKGSGHYTIMHTLILCSGHVSVFYLTTPRSLRVSFFSLGHTMVIIILIGISQPWPNTIRKTLCIPCMLNFGTCRSKIVPCRVPWKNP